MKVDRDQKILLIIVICLMVLSSLLGALAIWNNQKNPILKSDAAKFKEEYEAFNGQMNEQNKLYYPIVEVNEENPVVYKTDDEVAKILESGTGIIYFGFASCPWCRTAIALLLKAAESTNLGEIIYLDIEQIRDQLELDDFNQITVTEEGTHGYQEILKQLDTVLEPYYLEADNGDKIDTNEKRLYAPTVVTVKDGAILDIHVNTVATQTNGYNPLTSSEEEELFTIYQQMILKLLDSSCDEAC